MNCGCDCPAIQAHGLALRPAPGAPIVLEDSSFEIPAGCRAALVGANGAGKSTLLRALAGLNPIEAGELKVFGLTPKVGRAHLALLSQRPSLTAGLPCSVQRLVEMGRLVGRSPWGWKSHRADRDCALAALEAVHLAPLAQRLLHELSGGQLQRALIARALAQGATLLLLDEPYVGLDEASRAALNEVLFGPALTGVTLLVATHDAMDIGKLDRVLTVQDHKVTVTHACEGGHLHRHA